MMTVLSAKQRERLSSELAYQMRIFLREHGHVSRAFNVQQDTPLSIIWGALKKLYGPNWDADMSPGDYLSVMRRDLPQVYLRNDPIAISGAE